MTKKEILQKARGQLAIDLNCSPNQWTKEITIVPAGLREGRRMYQKEASFFRLVCFGEQTLISAHPDFIPWCKEQLQDESSVWILEYPNLEKISAALKLHGHRIADMHSFYLPDPLVPEVKPTFSVQWYEREEILQFHGDDRFGEAFAYRKECPDMLGVAAMDGSKIMGMAGASADSSTMWQIGIDVLPEYRGRGIAAQLTALLKQEVLRRGYIPFYGTSISHLISQNVAYRAGFFPAWTEAYTEPRASD